MDPIDWPDSPELFTPRLRLEPLRVEHATELARVLDDPKLHTFIGGEPATEVELRARFTRQVTGRSADGRQRWFNWTVRDGVDGSAVGTLQATVYRSVDDEHRVDVAAMAWVIATGYQGRGYAREAAAAAAAWLRSQASIELEAFVHPDHSASMVVARSLGMAPTTTVVDGEIRWSTLRAD